MTALLLGGCGEDQGAVPQVPAPMVQHPEPPIGTALNHRLARASGKALERLEPQWGKFSPAIYTADADQLAQIAPALRRAIPRGWQEVDIAGDPLPDSQLLAFSHGKQLFAALVVEPGGTSVVPVLILRNDALVRNMKAAR